MVMVEHQESALLLQRLVQKMIQKLKVALRTYPSDLLRDDGNRSGTSKCPHQFVSALPMFYRGVTCLEGPWLSTTTQSPAASTKREEIA